MIKAKSSKGPRPALTKLLITNGCPRRFLPQIGVAFAYCPNCSGIFTNKIGFVSGCSLSNPVPRVLKRALGTTRGGVHVKNMLSNPFHGSAFRCPRSTVHRTIIGTVVRHSCSPVTQNNRVRIGVCGSHFRILDPNKLCNSIALSSVDRPNSASAHGRALTGLLRYAPFHGTAITRGQKAKCDLVGELLLSGNGNRPRVCDALGAFSIAFHSTSASGLPSDHESPHCTN